MTDIDCHSEMTAFHKEKVTLSKIQQDDMRTRRDAGRTRLETGLDLKEHPQPKEVQSQGSYQMRTMTQDDANDYDIDDGAYFEKLLDSSGNQLTPLAARERVCEALKWDGRLKHEAEVKRNCVRQAYPAGYHIDVPVYRIVTTKNSNDEDETHFELASGDEWIKSDARAVTRWFNEIVGELNTGVADGSQMRRITKLTKKFARRIDWKEKTTSGISITRLVADHFVSSDARDDTSLQKTWVAVRDALLLSTEIAHPVLEGSKLAKQGDADVVFFRDCLDEAVKTLEILDDTNCTRKQARTAWDEVFETTFFSDQPDDDGEKKSEGSALTVTSVETARRNDGGGRFG